MIIGNKIAEHGEDLPPIRIIHHMARSGGTLISKCLAAMDSVTLLSEIHPSGIQYFNPIAQAIEWFDLLTEEDIKHIEHTYNFTFNDAIKLVKERCRERGELLVIRDWAHLDFTAAPFLEMPTYQLTTADVLKNDFSLYQIATVRHPIDQWLSLMRLQIMQNAIGLEEYLLGCRKFAEKASKIGFIRYEDFTANPDKELKVICDQLNIPFDANYKERWSNYSKITGDTKGARSQKKIQKLERRPIEEELSKRIKSNDNYLSTIELLGYDD